MKPCFNTSHVTLYQMHSWTATICFDVSIHHMLLFIASAEPVLSPTIIVSIHHMLLFIGYWTGNSSHVWTFQYITCYSLSSSQRCGLCHTIVSIHHMLLFITYKPSFLVSVRSFNTSHVTLYQFRKREIFSCFVRFNTSHVTLYHLKERASDSIQTRFNTSHVTLYRKPDHGKRFWGKFQYITCYSLSNQ